MTIDEWKGLSQIFQQVVVSIAVLVGGAWTLFRYIRLDDLSKARIEQEKLKLELEKANLERMLKTLIDIKIGSTTRTLDSGQRLLLLEVAVSNIGNRSVALKYEETFMTLRRVRQTPGQDDAVDTPVAIGLAPNATTGEPLAGTALPVGYTRRLPFAATLAEPGLYLLEFETQAPLTPEEETRLKEYFQDPDGTYLWDEASYVFVP